jgi:excisionase family DNA binding protein
MSGRQLVREMKIPFQRVGSSVRLKLSELDEWSLVPDRKLKVV